MAQDRFEAALYRAIAKHRAEMPEQRNRIYAAARDSLQRAGKSSEDIAALEDAIRKVESTFDAPSASMARSFARSNSWTALLFGGGLIAGAGAAYLLLSGLPKTGSNADTALPHQQLLRAYNEQLPLMPEAVSYLRELSAEIVRRQKEAPTSLRVEKTLMLLSIFDGDLAKKMPASLPQGTEAVIRVSATDYKIMLNWTLCGTAAIYSPEMVDKVRATVSTIGCPYFGVWTPGAAGW